MCGGEREGLPQTPTNQRNFRSRMDEKFPLAESNTLSINPRTKQSSWRLPFRKWRTTVISRSSALKNRCRSRIFVAAIHLFKLRALIRMASSFSNLPLTTTLQSRWTLDPNHQCLNLYPSLKLRVVLSSASQTTLPC